LLLCPLSSERIDLLLEIRCMQEHLIVDPLLPLNK
jgi:hypothetical protein